MHVVLVGDRGFWTKNDPFFQISGRTLGINTPRVQFVFSLTGMADL